MCAPRNKLLSVAAALALIAGFLPRPADASIPSAVSHPQLAQSAAPVVPTSAPGYVLLHVAPDGSFRVEFCRNDPVNVVDPLGLYVVVRCIGINGQLATGNGEWATDVDLDANGDERVDEADAVLVTDGNVQKIIRAYQKDGLRAQDVLSYDGVLRSGPGRDPGGAYDGGRAIARPPRDRDAGVLFAGERTREANALLEQVPGMSWPYMGQNGLTPAEQHWKNLQNPEYQWHAQNGTLVDFILLSAVEQLTEALRAGLLPVPRSSGAKRAATLRPKGVPEKWVAKPTKGAGGVKWYDPDNPHNNVRVMPGDPESPYPNSQKPYVRDVRNGQHVDSAGNVVNKYSPAGHQPLETYEYK